MKKIGIFTYGGSGNHGCEALLRTTRQILPDAHITVFSQRIEDDKKYCSDLDVDVKISVKKLSFFERVLNKIDGNRIQRRYAPTIKGSQDQDIMISIGGDNYCYPDSMLVPGALRKKFKAETKTVLLGCSIDEKAFENKAVLEDLNSYDLITAREQLSYELLKGKLSKPVIKYYPDSAFFLPKTNNIPLPSEGEFVGINLSPMVIAAEKTKGSVLDNAIDLIDFILNNTSMKILLIPHVVWEGNDDRLVLRLLYEKYKETNKVFFIEDSNCCDIKGIISKCRFFIGARTHSTIAAYSSCVPTLVIGYSVKSIGIANDLFGSSNHYVVSVQDIKNGILLESFKWLMENEEYIKKHLNEVMPDYINRAYQVKEQFELL